MSAPSIDIEALEQQQKPIHQRGGIKSLLGRDSAPWLPIRVCLLLTTLLFDACSSLDQHIDFILG
jgi:hypothetical protein